MNLLFRLLALLLLVDCLFPLPAVAQLGLPAPSETAEPSPGTDANVEVRQLIEALQNDETRARILQSLEAGLGDGEIAAGPEIDEAAPPQSFGRRVAEITGAAAEGMASRVSLLASQIATAPRVFSALDADRIEILLWSVQDLLLLVVATYGVFWLLRRGAKRLFAAIDRRTIDSGAIRWLITVIVSAVIDALVVAAAWAVGYVITLTLLGSLGAVGLRQTLFLNAFLVVEMAKILVRIVLSPAAPSLRLMNLTTATATYLSNRLSLIIALLGFGQLLFLPIANATTSYAVGQAVSVLFSLLALAIAVWMVISNRRSVRRWMIGHSHGKALGRERRLFARFWHWPALILLAILGIVILTQPFQALISMIWSVGQILLALLVGHLVARWITAAIGRGVALPHGLNQRLPLLERRLNSLVPKMLSIIRVVIFVVVLAFVLDAVGALDLRASLESRIGLQLTAALVSVGLILVVALAVWLALTSWVDYRLNPEFGKVATARESTLLTLLRNAATITLIVITLMFALSELGIDIAPLLASAGVLGLAIGFGAQKLVQDIITGIFIQLENAINVGDVISVSGITGTVERLTIRSVSLRDLEGSYHIIPFSSVDTVTNYMRDFSYYLSDVGVAYREDVEEAKAALFDAYEALRTDPDHSGLVIGDMEWFGVQALADSAVILRTRIKTLPGKQWAVGRAFNQEVKRVLDERGIEIPFPHQTLYFGEAKQGATPPARVQVLGRQENAREENAEGDDAMSGGAALSAARR